MNLRAYAEPQNFILTLYIILDQYACGPCEKTTLLVSFSWQGCI